MDAATLQIVSLLMSHLSATAINVYILQWLKGCSKVTWITAQTKNLNRVLAVVLSGLKVIGIHAVWNPESHSLLITGLTLMGIITLAWHWFNSFVLQELMYRMAVKTAAPTNGAAPTNTMVAAMPPLTGRMFPPGTGKVGG